ncbi:MAG: YopX family protein [Saprospiraceae bacterium]
MRDIKFRTWDTIKKVMGVPETIINPVQTESPEGINCFDLMQYVGRKDKNGVDIYEDDWCRAEFRTKEGIQVIQGRIIMDEYMWCIDCTGSVGDDIFSINRPHNFDVIGNVFQNPELLGQ